MWHAPILELSLWPLGRQRECGRSRSYLIRGVEAGVGRRYRMM